MFFSLHSFEVNREEINVEVSQTECFRDMSFFTHGSPPKCLVEADFVKQVVNNYLEPKLSCIYFMTVKVCGTRPLGVGAGITGHDVDNVDRGYNCSSEISAMHKNAGQNSETLKHKQRCGNNYFHLREFVLTLQTSAPCNLFANHLVQTKDISLKNPVQRSAPNQRPIGIS